MSIKISMQRENDDDGLKQILDLASIGTVKNSLTTYAVAALPYVSLATDFVNQAYESFNAKPEQFLSSAPFTLVSDNSSANRFTLLDGYVLVYQGNDPSLTDGGVYVDSGEVKKVSDSSPLRGGATWVLFKISKGKTQNRLQTRAWYQGWENAVLKATAQQFNSDGIKTQFQQAVTLLEADNDFTEGDKAYYIQQFNRVELAITTELAKASPDFSAMQQSVQDASQAVQQIKVQPGQPTVTATNSLAPTISTAAATFNPAAATHLAAPGIPAPVVPVADRAVVPNMLADRLAAVAAQASTF